MGWFNKEPLSVLPIIPKIPELTFELAGREYWLGMRVKDSGLKFVREKDATKKLKPNKNTVSPVAWMEDAYGNKMYVGFVNRGTETLEYQDAEIAYVLLNLGDCASHDQASFFNNLGGFSNPEQVREAFSDSNFSEENPDNLIDGCLMYSGDKCDTSFTFDDGYMTEVQFNYYG